MFSNYEIREENNEEVLYLYLEFNYETANEFGIASNTSLLDQIKKYIKEKKIAFHGKKVCLLAGGILISLLLTGPNALQEQTQFVPTPIIATNSVFQENYTMPDLSLSWESIPREPVPVLPSIEEGKQVEQNPPVIQPDTVFKEDTFSSIKPDDSSKENTSSVRPNSPSHNDTSSSQKPSNNPSQNITMNPQETMITVIRSNGVVQSIPLEEYVVGVVGAEMPASFHSEALKAQAVVARTYALRKTEAGYALSDTTADQVYKDQSQLQRDWGSQYSYYFNKVKEAVSATKGQVVTYRGQYIDAVYFSNSNGKTEDAMNVWGHEIPYLKSVDSHWDIGTSAFHGKLYKTFSEVSTILGFPVDEFSGIEIVSRTISNRVERVRIGDHVYTGLEIRNLFKLRSTDFDVSVDSDGWHFSTKGYGHGVGMSQYGANGMAREGYSYRAILHYYYKGIQIEAK